MCEEVFMWSQKSLQLLFSTPNTHTFMEIWLERSSQRGLFEFIWCSWYTVMRLNNLQYIIADVKDWTELQTELDEPITGDNLLFQHYVATTGAIISAGWAELGWRPTNRGAHAKLKKTILQSTLLC